MKIQFDTEEEAQEALDAVRIKGLKFCPLIKRDCIKNCICYYEGAIDQSNPVSQPKCWFVQYPCCTNVLISGVITVENWSGR